MKHCKSCRRDLETSAYNDNQKTCRECLNKRKNKKLTIEQCHEFAKTKGGLCLSTEYTDNKTKMDWDCAEGHQWTATFNHIKNSGQCCAVCAGKKKLTIEECKQLAKSKGGKCLSTEYKCNNTKMSWECSAGHQWDSNFDHIKRGSWCPECAGQKRLTIEQCRDFAQSKNGLCLSTEYKNIDEKMSWQCSKNHIWTTRYNDIKNNGTWCPNCASHKSEKLCREIFEDLLLEPFSTKRPPFLEGLELDGFNESLNIAFEYNGKQHYEFNKRFHNNDPEEFEQQKARDKKKNAICQKRGLNLIIVPYQYDFRNPEEMRDFIFNEIWKIS